MRQDHATHGGPFPRTRWSVIEALRGSDAPARERALETLCEAYWKPVYKYVRLRWNKPAPDAQDLTQSFFAQMQERGLLNRFQPQRSRLRTYLRVCVDSFLLNEAKAAGRQKRGGNMTHVALDFTAAEEELGAAGIDPATIASPESVEEFFEKEWIRSLFALAVEDLRKMCQAHPRSRAFAIFEAYDLEGDDGVSYDRLAEQFGISVSDVTNGLAWARREFRRVALDRLREICGSDDEFRREAKALFGWERQ